jgi:dTMP kinase
LFYGQLSKGQAMAGNLTEEQVEQVAQALQSLKANDESYGLSEIVSGLRDSAQTVFSEEALESISAAVSALHSSFSSKPLWNAAKDRGSFLVFEGLDRSGKSTQSKLLTEKLEKVGPVKWMCFPNRNTAVGILIDMYLRRQIELRDETVHQLFSANRWESVASIVETLNSGTTVVCDRYAFSGVAYSAAKGLDLAWCQTPDIGLPVPDGVFFLHVDESVGASRANFGDERYENADMQGRVRNVFRETPLRAGVNWNDVDGARDIQVIHSEIYEAVQDIWKSEQENPVRQIRRLWVA